MIENPRETFEQLCAFVEGERAKTGVPGVAVGDSAEMQWVPHTLGVLHATGYPLYTILGWAWSHAIPVGTVAYRMNALSAVLGAGAVALGFLALMYDMNANMARMTEHVGSMAGDVAAIRDRAGRQVLWIDLPGSRAPLLARHLAARGEQVAVVDEKLCSACKTCISLCPYTAITFLDDKNVANINEALCKGCGTCAAPL